MSIADLRHSQTATIWKRGIAAAHITRTPGGNEFQYLDDYRGPAVATSLPMGVEPVLTPAGALPPFFAGLLPEGRRLQAIRRATKTSSDDELTLLLAVGTDTIGDVQITPEEKPPETAQSLPSTSLDQADFAALFERAVSLDPEDRVALPGVQDKVSDAMITLPVALAGHAWILKLDPPEFPHLVENEAFFMAAARHSGLEVAESELVRDVHGRPGLLIRRFDRMDREGERTALAQEDACQVLGRYPADKYRITTEELIQGLAGHTGAPMVAARALLAQVAFAYVTCNGDAHGKNFSILERDGEWRAAPAYDLPSTHPYGDVTMALPLAGRDREDIRREDFLTLGEACGVRHKATERVLDQLVKAAPDWLQALEDLPFDERRTHKLRKACQYRVEQLRG